MQSSEYSKYFVETTELLLHKLETWLPNDESIKSALFRFKNAQTVTGPKLIITQFMEHILPHRDLLWKKNTKLFDLVSDFGNPDMFHHLNEEQQAFVWKKLEAMVLLAAKALNIPHESLFTTYP
jgi:hypothetical protein